MFASQLKYLVPLAALLTLGTIATPVPREAAQDYPQSSESDVGGTPVPHRAFHCEGTFGGFLITSWNDPEKPFEQTRWNPNSYYPHPPKVQPLTSYKNYIMGYYAVNQHGGNVCTSKFAIAATAGHNKTVPKTFKQGFLGSMGVSIDNEENEALMPFSLPDGDYTVHYLEFDPSNDRIIGAAASMPVHRKEAK